MTSLLYHCRRVAQACVLAAAVLLCAVTSLRAEDLTQTYTRPEPPAREALERLNLKTGWSLYLPVEGLRDGIFSIQVLEKELFVQTRSGLVVVVDADTGKIKWRARVSRAYHPSQPLGYNRSAVFLVGESVLYALDRDDGKTLWQILLPKAPSAPPVADEEQLYLVLGGRLNIFLIPTRQELEDFAKGSTAAKPASPPTEASAKEPRRSAFGVRGNALQSLNTLSSVRQESAIQTIGPQPHVVGEFEVATRVDQALLRTAETLLLPGADGKVIGMTRLDTKQVYRLPLDGGIALQPGQFAEVSYIASQDYNLYAVNTDTGRVLWRFTEGTIFSQQPAVNDQSVFLPTERRGMYCLDRESGTMKWRNPDSGRFLAANPKFVYAADRSNRFLVLDRERGTTLSTYDLRDFVFPVANEQTDRIYLAAHNGLLVSLHDRDYAKPLTLKRELKPPPDAGKPADAPPPTEKPSGPGDKDQPKEPVDKSKDKNDKGEKK